MHLGHREVIRGADTVLTFDPHPASVVAPSAAPRLLTTLERKAELVGALGVEELVVIPFDSEFAVAQRRRSSSTTCSSRRSAPTHVSVGENFRFGHKAQGDPALLQADDRFETRVVPLLEVDGEVVSSSHIRGLVLGGAVEYAGQLLGAPFVAVGRGRPRRQARPRRSASRRRTSSRPSTSPCPGHGVYACSRSASTLAAVNVGVRPTFDTGRGELIEAYLIDFDGDLYGAGHRHRVPQAPARRAALRLASTTLVAQMNRDVERDAGAFATAATRRT